MLPDEALTFTGMKILLHVLITLIIYTLLDLIFINFLAKGFIQRQVGQLLATEPNLMAGLLFYCIFSVGLLYFCIWPAETAAKALFNGAFFGLVAYATYELVNRALLADWPWKLVVVDLAWGIIAGALVCWASWHLGNRLRL